MSAAATPNPWTDSEHSRFLQALEKFGNANTGNEWQEMAKFVGTRTHNEIKLHAHRYFVQLQAVQALAQLLVSQASLQPLQASFVYGL